MKKVLNLEELDVSVGVRNEFSLKEYSVSIYKNGDIIGTLDFMILRESNSIYSLEGYLDQCELDNCMHLKYLKLKDAGYGDYLTCGDLLFIDKIYLDEKNRGNGIGSRVLKEIIKYTKSIGIDRIVLSPQPIGVNNEEDSFNERVSKLELWYSKYGFNTYAGSDDEFKYMILSLIK